MGLKIFICGSLQGDMWKFTGWYVEVYRVVCGSLQGIYGTGLFTFPYFDYIILINKILARIEQCQRIRQPLI